MIYPTPAADFDGVKAGLRLLDVAIDLIALAVNSAARAKDEPDRKAEYLQEAANLAKDAWLALQTAAGRAIQEEEDEKELAGLARCIRCKEWKPKEETLLMSSRPEAKRSGKSSHWTECRACVGKNFHVTIFDENEVIDLFDEHPEAAIPEPNLFEDEW